MFRAADVVEHGPSGETWVLACDQDGDSVMPAGWPETRADAKDCTLKTAATDKERLDMLKLVCKPRYREGLSYRYSLAQHQLDKHMKLEELARATHEMNRTYCQLMGDDSQVHWEDAPEWQRESAIEGVKAVLDGTANTPEEQHEAWAEHKTADGWVYGPEKDPEKKTHPCLVPYDELPAAQRVKDTIFRAVIEGLRD